MTIEPSEFAARLCDLISRADFPAEAFGNLALELFALQYQSNAAYQTFCASRKVTPLTVCDWRQIPAIPTAAFKDFEITCLPPEHRSRVFHSSGTTEQRPSRHFHSETSLAVYESSLWNWFSRNLPSPLAAFRLVVLTPPPPVAANSSLVHMFEVIRRHAAATEATFLGRLDRDGAWGLDLDSATRVLRDIERRGQSALVLGTAFSFVHLADQLAEAGIKYALPTGSWVMETGGYKGRSRRLPKSQLHELIIERLGVAASNIFCEYGMSELSSQAYDRVTGTSHQESGSPRCFRFPPWVRTQILSPESGRAVGEGQTGLLRVFDLANVYSVMAIQTEDLAVLRGEGFELIGRAQLAEPRGCSLMAV